MKKVLVTGAAGFSGRHACRRLASSGYEVTALISLRASEQGVQPVEGAAGTIACNLTDRDRVIEAFATIQPDAIVHLAGRNAVEASWQAPDLTLAANLMSTVFLLEGARRLPGCRVLIVGSMLRPQEGALEASLHPYGFSKAVQVSAAQAWHQWYGLPVVVAEPSNLIGPGSSAGICGKIAAWAAEAELAAMEAWDAGYSRLPKPFRLSSTDERRDFLDVRDAAVAYELLLREGVPGATYAMESGLFRSLGEVKAAFDTAAVIPLPWEIGQSVNPSPRERDSSAIRALGWRPSIPFAQSIQDTLQSERMKRYSGQGGG